MYLFFSLCFLYSSTICPGTAFSLKWRPMFLKPSVLSSHHDCCHSRLIPGSCLKMARHTARYCTSFPSAIIFAKRVYSSLCASFHWRMSALNCSYVCFCSSMLSLQCYWNIKGYWGTWRMSSIQEVHQLLLHLVVDLAVPRESPASFRMSRHGGYQVRILDLSVQVADEGFACGMCGRHFV